MKTKIIVEASVKVLQLGSKKILKTYQNFHAFYFHKHQWEYSRFKDSNRTERKCNSCGLIEESRPEINMIFGEGLETWYIKPN